MVKYSQDMKLTYRELLTQLEILNDELLDYDVTVCIKDADEYFGCEELKFSDEKTNDVLDHDHPYITVNLFGQVDI